MHKATLLCKYIFFPAFQGSAGPFPLHCLTATRLRGPFQSGLGLYVKNMEEYFLMKTNWKSDLGVTRRKIWLKIHLRGATNGSESPITAARGCCKQPTGFFRQIFLVVKPKSDFHVVYNVPLYFCL